MPTVRRLRSGGSASSPATGSPGRSPRPPPRRPMPGRPSPTVTTPWSSRRPGRARRWPRSCGRSTLWPARRAVSASPAPGCFMCRRSRRSPSTSSATCARRWPGWPASPRSAACPTPEITVGLRSGDTPPAQRRQLISNPPDVLITTPESLFLMLTSAARETLAGVQTVIVDEVHAIAGTKRGAHLALSLERLDDMLPKPAQRIGLSATVRPAEEVARFLSGPSPTTIVSPPSAKTFELSVQVPIPDMANLENGSIWPDVEAQLVDLVETHNSTIVFANSRRLAERLTARLNEIHAERTGSDAARRRQPESCRRCAGPPAGQRPNLRRPDAVGPRPPRLGQQGTAGHRRRGPEIRPAQGGGGDVEPGVGHRHGRRRPGHPGRSAAVGGQRPATHRSRRTPGRRDLARRAVPQAPHRSDRLRGDRSAHARRSDRDDAGADQPARHPGPAHRGGLGVGATGRRPLVRHRPAQRTVCDAAAQRIRGHAGSAVRQVPVDRVRRTAATAGLRPRQRNRDGASRRAAARGHLRRRHPGSRPVHRLPGDRLRNSFSGRRTRRGDGLRIPAGRCHRAGRHQLADHRDHPRPGAGDPGARPAGPAAVLARRRLGASRRTRPRDRRVHRRAGRARSGSVRKPLR